MSIGQLGDCIAGLQRAITYLKPFEDAAYV